MKEHESFTKGELMAGLSILAHREQLDKIAHIIEAVDQRCGAADGPVSATRDEITAQELREIYRLATEHPKKSLIVGNLAMLVKRFIRKLRKLAPDDPLPSLAHSYLKRCGLEGSALREVAIKDITAAGTMIPMTKAEERVWRKTVKSKIKN